MIFLIALIVTVVIVVAMSIKNAYDAGDVGLNILFGFIIYLGIVFIMGLAGHVIIDSRDTDKSNHVIVAVERQEIVALADNFSTGGKFFLGSGSVSGAMYYSYMVEQGSYKTVKTMKAEGVLIDDSGSIEPSIEHQTIEPPDGGKGIYWWFWTPKTERVIIHIPPGSIDYHYSIDLK